MKKFLKFLSRHELTIICSAASVGLIFIIWLIAYFAVKNDYIIPSIGDMFVSLGECFSDGSFWTAFAFTMLRTLLAAIISFAAAAFFAVLSVLSKVFSAILKPIVGVLRALPTLAIVLILLIWTSPSIAPVAVTGLVLLPMMYTQIMAAVEGIDAGLVEMAEVYRIPAKERLFKMYLPLVSSNVLLQTGANFSLGLKVMISAEVLASTYKSLGGLMQLAKIYLEIPRLAALTFVAVLAGIIIECVFAQIEKVTFKWRKKEGAE